MVYRSDTTARYKAFLNEWLEYCQADLPVTLGELVKKYGISSTFSSHVSRQGLFTPFVGLGSRGKWKAKKTESFTDLEVKNLIDSYNAYKYSKRTPVIKDRLLGEVPTANGNKLKLTDVSTQELITELRRRGYKGKITSEINF